MTKVKIKLWLALLVVGALAVAYTFGTAGTGPSKQGSVVRVEVTASEGPFSVNLDTESSLTGRRDWVPPGRTYTGTFAQDILLSEGERMRVHVAAATDIDREIEKRTLGCQIYLNGKALPPPAIDRSVIRRGEAGEPVGCTALVTG